MASSWLLLGVAWASHCCSAFHVDHFDAHRRLTRVNYDPSVKAPEVSVHYNTPSGRRLDWHDAQADGYLPYGDTPDVTLLTVNPDELYVHMSDNTVTIYGTDVTLDEYMYNVDKDLVVVAGRIRLPSHMHLNSKPEWTGEIRTVYLQAMEIIVPDAGGTIDVAGDAGITTGDGLPASHGVDPGDSGTDGADGGAGGPGGYVKIQAGELVGGLLTIKVDGGVGGNGQNGGDGAVGDVGERRTDIDDCCSAKTGQDGNPGGPGGDAGLGGNGGQGGSAGFADVQIGRPLEANMTNLPIQNLLIQGQPGAGGAAGVAGLAGAGGAGGPGIMTKCVSINIFWWNKMCTFPIGNYGVQGTDGENGTDGAPGKTGSYSDMGVASTSEVSLHELRASGNGQNLRYELYLADKLYRSGMYAEAQKLYVWIEAVLHTNHTDVADGTENVPWRQIGLEAAVRITQLRRGLDFWGRQKNHAPLLSFNAMHENLLNLLDIAKDAEAAFDTYYAEGTSETERKNLIVKALKNLDYEIAVTESLLVTTKTAIEEERVDILALQDEQDMWMQLVMAYAEECDAGITEYEASINSGLNANLKKLSTLATNGWALWGTVAAVTVTGLGVWTLMSAQVPGIMDSVVNSVSSGSSLQTVIQSNIDTSVPAIQTLVTDTMTQQANVVSDYASVSAALDTITAQMSEESTRVSGIRTQTNVQITMEEFLSIRTEYLDTIPECAPVRDDYTYLRDVSTEMLSLIESHDMNVVTYASLTVQRSTLQSERDELLKSVTGTFDPTSLQVMQSIGQAYRAQKDRIIELLKMLHEAVDFEFCDQSTFEYEDVRVAQLQSYLAQISGDRMRRLADDTSSRGILQEHTASGEVSAVTKITLTPDMSNNMALAFNSFWANGTLVFNIDMTNEALPAGVANIRVVNAQAFVPALLLDEYGTRDLAEVWMRKLGTSTCKDPAGNERLFSHAASGYYSAYSAKVDPRLTDSSPTWLTQHAHHAGAVGPSPIGTWQISVPALQTEEERTQVQSVELHLFLSYVPCTQADCGASTEETPTLSFHSKRSHFENHRGVTALTLFGAAAVGSVLTIAAVFGLERRASRRAIRLASPRTDETELRETQ